MREIIKNRLTNTFSMYLEAIAAFMPMDGILEAVYKRASELQREGHSKQYSVTTALDEWFQWAYGYRKRKDRLLTEVNLYDRPLVGLVPDSGCKELREYTRAWIPYYSWRKVYRSTPLWFSEESNKVISEASISACTKIWSVLISEDRAWLKDGFLKYVGLVCESRVIDEMRRIPSNSYPFKIEANRNGREVLWIKKEIHGALSVMTLSYQGLGLSIMNMVGNCVSS